MFLIHEAPLLGGVEQILLIFSSSEVIPVVGEHRSKDPRLRLVVTIQQDKQPSNTDRVYNLTE